MRYANHFTAKSKIITALYLIANNYYYRDIKTHGVA